MRRFVISQNEACTTPLPWWEKYGSVPTMPTGKRLGIYPQTAGIPDDDFRSRGILFSGTNEPNRQYWCINVSPDRTAQYVAQIGKNPGSWNQADCYDFGKNFCGYSGLVACQLSETNTTLAMSYEGYGGDKKQQYEWVLEGMRDKARQTNPKGWILGEYKGAYNAYFGDALTWNPLDSANTAALASPVTARAGLGWYGSTISQYGHPIIQTYPFVQSRDYFYTHAFSAQRLTLAAEGYGDGQDHYGPVSYFWFELITPQNGYQGHLDRRFAWQRQLSDGTLYIHWAAFDSYNLGLAKCLLGFIIGDGVVMWDDGVRFDAGNPRNRANDNDEPYGSAWTSPSGAAKPDGGPRPNYPRTPRAFQNLGIMAAGWYAQACQVAGTAWKFAPFRVNGGAQVVPDQNGSLNSTIILQRAALRQGFAIVQSNDATGGYAIFYCNPHAPDTGETVAVDFGSGYTITFDVYGDEPVYIFGTFSQNETLLRTTAILTNPTA